MSPKTHPSQKNKSLKCDEHRLLNNKIDSLAEVMDKMNTRPKGRHNRQNISYKHYIHRGRDHRIYPSYDRGYNRGIGNYRQRFYNRN